MFIQSLFTGKIMKKVISALLLSTILFNVTACGTILYPERKGQRAGQIDPAVAILDGVGLLVFLIPGVIAYAVDFSNGTIYLPGGKRSSLDGEFHKEDMVALNVGKDNLSSELIKAIVSENAGEDISTSAVEIYKLDAEGHKVRLN